jgi:flagellar biosynthesis protein FliP
MKMNKNKLLPFLAIFNKVVILQNDYTRAVIILSFYKEDMLSGILSGSIGVETVCDLPHD